MLITLNGEPREIPDALTAAGLIELLDLNGKRLAMEVNEAIVPRSTFDSRAHLLFQGEPCPAYPRPQPPLTTRW